MRPLAVLTAIVFGSATAISFGLGAVLLIFVVLRADHPRLASEFGPLLRSAGAFLVLAVCSGVSLYATLRRLTCRWIAQGAMWFILAALVWLYWPE